MNEIRIKKLKPEIKKNGYLYELVKRLDGKCIYAQKDGGRLIAYEVFKTKLTRPHPKMLEDLQNYDKVETFPSDEEFGVRAWTFKTLQEAELAFDAK
jgi:hypothetical protein